MKKPIDDTYEFEEKQFTKIFISEVRENMEERVNKFEENLNRSKWQSKNEQV